jgi:hypothetical protein
VYVFCIGTVVRVRVLYWDSGTCTCFVLGQWYVYVFCIGTVVRVRVLYWDSGTREKSLKSTEVKLCPPRKLFNLFKPLY